MHLDIQRSRKKMMVYQRAPKFIVGQWRSLIPLTYYLDINTALLLRTCSPRALCWIQPSLIYCLCSVETRQKIGIGVRKAWERKNLKRMLQEACVFYWKNLIAEASRQGFVGEEEMQWNSCGTLDEQLKHMQSEKSWERWYAKRMLEEDCVFYWKNLIAEASRQGFAGEEEMQWNSYETLDEQLKQEWLEGLVPRKKLRWAKEWKRKHAKRMLQETCVFYWKNLIAESSRQGVVGGEETQWNSYETLAEQLKQEWLEDAESREKVQRAKYREREFVKRMSQKACVFYWKNLIAEASRQGFVVEEDMQWNSYETMAEQLKQEWIEDVESRKNMRRAKYRVRGFVKRMLQKACVFYWKNLIAEASRQGFVGEEELQWNTYEALDE